MINSKYNKEELLWLIDESEELDNILGSIVKKTKNNRDVLARKVLNLLPSNFSPKP